MTARTRTVLLLVLAVMASASKPRLMREEPKRNNMNYIEPQKSTETTAMKSSNGGEALVELEESSNMTNMDPPPRVEPRSFLTVLQKVEKWEDSSSFCRRRSCNRRRRNRRRATPAPTPQEADAYYVAAGNPSFNGELDALGNRGYKVATTQAALTRCCNGNTCSTPNVQLSTNTAVGAGSCGNSVGSNLANNCGGTSCSSSGQTWSEAQSVCQAFEEEKNEGYRLCDKDELEGGECNGQGGQCDRAPIWTRTKACIQAGTGAYIDGDC